MKKGNIITILIVIFVVLLGVLYIEKDKENILLKQEQIEDLDREQDFVKNEIIEGDKLDKNVETAIQNLGEYRSYVGDHYSFDYPETLFINENDTVKISSGDCEKQECIYFYEIFLSNGVDNMEDLKSLMLDRYTYGLGPAENIVWSYNNKIDGKPSLQLNRSIPVGAGHGMEYPLPVIGTIYNSQAYIIADLEGEDFGMQKKEFDNIVSSFDII